MLGFNTKEKPKKGRAELKPAAPPAEEALILICEKCGKKMAGNSGENPAREIQAALKEKIKECGLKGKYRAVVTSCMDICPFQEIAIGISHPKGEDRFLTATGDAKEISGLLVRALNIH